jgi:3-deoxy-D-manno-octulosonate 8-phosphate phosphatase (KDO 8-P phosphatase)
VSVPLGDADFTARARALAWLLFDVDGVLTDGRLYYGAGEPLVAFDIKDGWALKAARRAGLRVGILTGRNTPAVTARAADLGLDATILGREDKGAAFDEFLARCGCGAAQVAYVGDDLLDLPVLRRAGLALCPADAAAEVRAAVHRVLARDGGRGAAREAVEAILGARGAWPPAS